MRFLRRLLCPCVVSFAVLLTGCEAILIRDRDRIDFGDRLVGMRSEARIASWTNIDDADVSVTTVTITGNDDGAFDWAHPQPTLPSTLETDDAQTVFFTFTPPAAGEFRATARPAVGAERSTDEVEGIRIGGQGVWIKNRGYRMQLVGRSIARAVAASGPIDFGATLVPSTEPAKRRMRLVNPTGAAVKVRLEWVRGDQGFSVADPTEATFAVPAGGEQIVQMRFLAAAVGDFQDTVVITPIDPNPALENPPIGFPFVGATCIGEGFSLEEEDDDDDGDDEEEEDQ